MSADKTYAELIQPTGFRKIVDPDGTFQMLVPPTRHYPDISPRSPLLIPKHQLVTIGLLNRFTLTVFPVIE
jgi:hypothetical protein